MLAKTCGNTLVLAKKPRRCRRTRQAPVKCSVPEAARVSEESAGGPVLTVDMACLHKLWTVS